MSVEFLGARYHGGTETKEKNHFYCLRFTHRRKGLSRRPGYDLFHSEIMPQMIKKHQRKGWQPKNLVGTAWRELTADQKEYYNRKAKENGPVKPMKKKCPGKLVFVKQAGMSVDGLISYVPHSDELSILIHDS